MTLTNYGTRRGWGIPCTLPLFLFLFSATAPAAHTMSSAELGRDVAQRESSGDLAGARSLLQSEAQMPGNTAAAEALAEFLDRHGDPGCRPAYLKWAQEETDPAKRQLALKQVVLMDFVSGKNADLAGDLDRYRAAGGTDLKLPGKASKGSIFSAVTIPGPLSSFARMAALSPDLAPEELLPALARNVVTNGYEASGNEVLQQTEYLKLVIRYVSQARELQAMAGSNRKIMIPTCDSEQTGNLLKILGYRMRGSCGSDLVLETVNPTRAFLTVDSGFPLTRLEQDLRADHKFELPYAPTTIPVLYNPAYWLSALGKNNQQSDFIDAFMSDPSLCRLYLGLSHVDRATAEALRKQAPAAKLRIYAHVLDFFGNMFQIRNGVAVVPGSPKAWGSLVGASPNNPGAFFEKLIATDDGWMASYFDALSRLSGPTAQYLTQPEHMKRFYEALRGKITSPGPARPVFRSSTELLLLTTSLRIDANGHPRVPGNLEVWRSLFIHHPHGKYDGKLTKSANSWRTNEDVLEALFALSRKTVENEPLRIFLALNDIDRDRTKPISPELASRLVNGYRRFGAQYVIFADEPSLSEESIGHYLDLCSQLLSMHDVLLRADTLGTAQSLVELWRILCRQNSIPTERRDAAFAKLIEPFSGVKQETELFNAGRSGVDTLLAAAGVQDAGSRQEALTELLVGKVRVTEGSAPSPAANFVRIFDDQRLIPLDALFTVVDHAGKGGIPPKTAKLINEQLDRLEETESLRGTLSPAEKSTFAVGYWSERHIEQERKFNLASALKGTEKRDVRASLAPFLRDSLVGILYSYYAPDGAQLLLTNPLFVRHHDFIGPEGAPAEWRDTEVAGTGWPESSGGRLIGSLVSLPYAIAEAEQNFLTPRREQALIWADLVPQMIVDVTVNRWRNVTPEQLRWVALHLERGRTLLAAAALDPAATGPVLDAVGRYTTPERVESVAEHLRAGDFEFAMGQIPTSVLYAIASDPQLKDVSPDMASSGIAALVQKAEPDLTPAAIARAFGTPKPTLTHSYQPGLLYLRTFPALMGYSSRILAESWESNNLYYAALADRAGIPANLLDAYVPEWNRSAIENIFATHLEDWPAILRSLQTVAKNVQPYGNQMAAANSSEN